MLNGLQCRDRTGSNILPFSFQCMYSEIRLEVLRRALPNQDQADDKGDWNQNTGGISDHILIKIPHRPPRQATAKCHAR